MRSDFAGFFSKKASRTGRYAVNGAWILPDSTRGGQWVGKVKIQNRKSEIENETTTP